MPYASTLERRPKSDAWHACQAVRSCAERLGEYVAYEGVNCAVTVHYNGMSYTLRVDEAYDLDPNITVTRT